MPEFASKWAGLSQGLQSGMNMGLQVEQAQRARRQQEWERDLSGVKVLMDYAGTKGATNSTRANSINQANSILKKYYPDMQLPAISAEQIPDYGEVLKSGGSLMKDLEKDPSKFQFAISEWGRHNAEWAAKGGANAERTATQKDIADQVTAGLKSMGDASGQGKSRDAKSPDEVLKEMFEINKSIAGMQQLDQQTANLMQIAPEAAAGLIGSRLSPEQLGQVKGMGAARMGALNDLLPEGRKLQPVTEEEVQALIKAGHSPEEVFRKTFIVQRKSGK